MSILTLDIEGTGRWMIDLKFYTEKMLLRANGMRRGALGKKHHHVIVFEGNEIEGGYVVIFQYFFNPEHSVQYRHHSKHLTHLPR